MAAATHIVYSDAAVKLADLKLKASRGGRRQRELAEREIAFMTAQGGSSSADDSYVGKFDSKTAFNVVKEWTTGGKSARKVQAEARHAYDDVVETLRKCGKSPDYAPQSLKALSQLGTWGKFPGNINRELKTWLGASDEPSPYMQLVWMNISKPRKLLGKAKRLPKMQQVLFPILLPHLLFHFLFTCRNDDFKDMFIGAGAGNPVESFWEGVLGSNDPRLEGHPMKARPDWMSFALPLSLHGDAVPCVAVGKSSCQSFDAYSWQGVLAKKMPTMRVKQYLFGLFERCKLKLTKKTRMGRDTMADIWPVVLWSFWFLYLGIFPTCQPNGEPWEDHHVSEKALAGEPLAGGFFGVLWLLKQDLDHLAKAYNLPHYAATIMCALCPAVAEGDDPQMFYSNFNPDAPWKAMMYTADTFRLLFPDCHPLFVFPFLSSHNVEPDELHVVHLGTTMWLLGSILWVLCFQLMTGTPSANLEEIWDAIMDEYKRLNTKCQFTSITLSMFINVQKPKQDYPRLKGRGAEIKGLLEPMKAVWLKFAGRKITWKARVTRVLDCQILVQDKLDSCKDHFLPNDSVKAIREAVDTLLLEYSELSNFATDREECLWNIVPKFHWYYHLAYRCCFLHPRCGSTWLDEDFVGFIKDVVAACTAGTPPHKVSHSVCDKIQWGKHVEYVGPPKF